MDKSQLRIKLVLFDVGGVLIQDNSKTAITDIVNSLNDASFSLNHMGIKTGFLSIAEDSDLIDDIKKSKLNYNIEATINKEESLSNFLGSKYNYSEIFYIADDILDIPVLQKVGHSACPANARREVKRVVKYLIRKNEPIEIINEVKNLVIANA